MVANLAFPTFRGDITENWTGMYTMIRAHAYWGGIIWGGRVSEHMCDEAIETANINSNACDNAKNKMNR